MTAPGLDPRASYLFGLDSARLAFEGFVRLRPDLAALAQPVVEQLEATRAAAQDLEPGDPFFRSPSTALTFVRFATLLQDLAKHAHHPKPVHVQ